MEELTVETKKKSLFWSLLDDKKQKWHVRFRFILVVAIALAAVILAILVIAAVRLRSSERHLYETNRVRIDTVLAGLGDGVMEQGTLNEEYDKIYIAKLTNTRYNYGALNQEIDDALLKDICEYADVDSAAIIDRVLSGVGAGVLALIVTGDGPGVCAAIDRGAGRGATVLKGYGGWQGQARDVVLCACSGKQAHSVEKAARSVDGGSFVILLPSSEVHGEGFRHLVIGQEQ